MIADTTELIANGAHLSGLLAEHKSLRSSKLRCKDGGLEFAENYCGPFPKIKLAIGVVEDIAAVQRRLIEVFATPGQPVPSWVILEALSPTTSDPYDD